MDLERKELVDRVFDGFSSRRRPSKVFDDRYVSPDGTVFWDPERAEFEEYLRGVRPRDLTFSVLDAYQGDRNVLLSFAETEGALYFLPSVVAMCIEDYERADLFVDQLAWLFRVYPFTGATDPRRDVLSWPDVCTVLPDAELQRDAKYLADWFLEGDPVRNRLACAMTMEERQALAEYFEFEVRTFGARYFGQWQYVERRSTIAFLLGWRCAERLGARDPDENRALIDAMAVLRRRLPGTFRGGRTEEVETELRRNLEDWSATP